MTDRIYKEEYLTKSYWRQIVEACRYTFENLDLVIDDEGFDRYDNYYFLGDEKFTLFGNSPMIKYMHIEIKRLEHGSTKLTINVHFFDRYGPWQENKSVKLGKEFIRTVKLAEFSNFTPELAKYNSEPVVNNASESSNSIPKHDDQNKHEPSLDEKCKKEEVNEIQKNYLNKKEKNTFYEIFKEKVNEEATEYIDKGLSIEELIKAGNSGLKKAIDDFDPSKGYIMSEIALMGIINGIERALAQHSYCERSGMSKSQIDLQREEIESKVNKLKNFIVLEENDPKYKIYESNLEFANQIASEYYVGFVKTGISFEAIKKAGNSGLKNAVERYDSSKHEFSIFAYIFIRQSIVKLIQSHLKENPNE